MKGGFEESEIWAVVLCSTVATISAARISKFISPQSRPIYEANSLTEIMYHFL